MKTLNFKKQIINVLIESYVNGNKDKMKKIIKSFKENKEMKELYLFYEEISKKEFDDKDLAKNYVEILSEQLKGKLKFLNDKKYDFLNENIEKYEINNEELYYNLDILCEEDTLNNIDKKLLAKKYLVEFLLCKKVTEEDEKIDNPMNESVLNTILTNNFNNYVEFSLNEEEKKELKNILSINSEELENKYSELKESITNKLSNLIVESNGELKEKLEMTNKEITSMNSSRYNYYKLLMLNNDL